jgi:hypothetical protein
MKTSKLKCKVSVKFLRLWVLINIIPMKLGLDWDFYIPAWAVKTEIIPDE